MCQSQATPLGNIRVYLFTPGGSYLSRYADTTAQGEVVFSLPDKSYKVRADYLGSQYWSQVFTWQDQNVNINHGKVDLHVTWIGEDVMNAPAYLFTDTGSYLGKSLKTDGYGHAIFEIPAKPYKFRVDYSGKQYWRDVTSVIADEEMDVDLALDQLALMPTNDPNPVRYDGEPPVWKPNLIKLASLGSLVGILSQASIAYPPAPVLYYYINDHLGTPQMLLDANGSAVWKATYKPFGEAKISPASTTTTNLRFPGQYYDTDTSLHYNYFRYFEAKAGRYISPDPIGLDEYKNAYNYSLANPINTYDPNGLWPTSIHNLIIRSAFGFLPSNLRTAIERGSRFADTLQDPRFAYIHAMRSKDQHPEVARKLMEAFVRDRLKRFQCESEKGNLEEAYFALGEALHPIMDSTSPTHEGFQWWDYLGRMPGYYIIYHWLTEQWYLDSEIALTADVMNQVLRENGINLRQ
jgi:RHS repeat-associated protein